MFERVPENRRVDALTNRLNGQLPFVVSNPADLQALRRAWAELDSIPCMMASREDGEDNSFPGLDVRTMLSGDNSSGRQCVNDIIIAAGGGLPPHAQRQGDSYWYVLSGELDVTIGSVREIIGRGGFAYAPADTTQAIANRSLEPARTILICFPAGVDRAFAEAHALWQKTGSTAAIDYLEVLARFGFDFQIEGPQKYDARTNRASDRLEMTIETPADFEQLRSDWRSWDPIPKLVRDAVGSIHHDRGAVTGHVVVSGDEDSGRAVLLLGDVQPKHQAPTHHQPGEEEMFFVLEGEIELICGSQTAVIGAGAFGFAPRFATHGYQNVSDGISRMVTCNSPAGHERGFEMMVRERANPSENFQELMVAHGWQMHRNVTLERQ